MKKKAIPSKSAAKKNLKPVIKKSIKKTPEKSFPKVSVTPKLPVTNKLPSQSTPELLDDTVGREKMMGSLSQILGKMEFNSDAELNAYLDSQFKEGIFPASLDIDPLDEAQSLIYEAWNTEGPEKIKLAERALELSENCADAYLILANANHKGGEKKTLEFYQKAVEAGKRTLGAGAFKQAVGAFWGIMETRPFMRAKFELAKYLADLDEVDKAIQHFQEMLELNPNDNQGVRYLLLTLLMEKNQDENALKLLNQFKDEESSAFLFTRALIFYRKEGKSAAAVKNLKIAIIENVFVAPYLLGKIKLPESFPEYISPGGPEEAQTYVLDNFDVWHSTKGAVQWLASVEK